MKNNFVHRPIEFRVWDKERQAFCSTDMLEFGCIFNLINGVLDLKNGKEYYIFQQFTGLLDKNGKKIFEGDIIKYAPFNSSCHGKAGIPYENGIVICPKYGTWCIKGKELYQKEILFDNSFTGKESEFEDEEVVGNIFENPELLK